MGARKNKKQTDGSPVLNDIREHPLVKEVGHIRNPFTGEEVPLRPLSPSTTRPGYVVHKMREGKVTWEPDDQLIEEQKVPAEVFSLQDVIEAIAIARKSQRDVERELKDDEKAALKHVLEDDCHDARDIEIILNAITRTDYIRKEMQSNTPAIQDLNQEIYEKKRAEHCRNIAPLKGKQHPTTLYRDIKVLKPGWKPHNIEHYIENLADAYKAFEEMHLEMKQKAKKRPDWGRISEAASDQAKQQIVEKNRSWLLRPEHLGIITDFNKKKKIFTWKDNGKTRTCKISGIKYACQPNRLTSNSPE